MDTNTHTYQSATKPDLAIPGEENELQLLIDYVFEEADKVERMDLLIKAETDDLPADLIEIVSLLPQGTYKRGRLCDQLNSIIVAHGWGYVWGTVE